MRLPPRARLRPRTTPARRVALAALVTGLAASSALVAGAAPAGATTVTMASSKTVTVTWRGNGHGHGLSQYGARGAARKGLTYRQIINFYYPHTTLVTRKEPAIRVLLAGFGSTVTMAASPGLRVSGVSGVLPSTHNGVARYRLVADSGSKLTLQRLMSAHGSKWTSYRTGLANRSSFTVGVGHSVREYAPDGSSNLYRGSVRAVRSQASGASALDSVNVVGLERYTAGVAPREMPASWPRAAVDSQAIAARTYAQYALDHPRNKDWDICDTTACQFYGGWAYIDPAGRYVWHDDTRGESDTHSMIATYRGDAIFSQFSASNGGWSVDGGQPYLVAKADPYDNAASGDPYLSLKHSVSTASLARYFGLSKITNIAMSTDGHGTWGGRSTKGYVSGVRAGKSVRVATTGVGLADALGAWTDWYQLVAT